MITKKDIVIFAQHIRGRRRGVSGKRLIHPVRDWSIGLGMTVAVCVGVSWYAGALFVSQLRSVDAVPVVEITVEEYNDVRVGRALDTFRERTATFETLYGQWEEPTSSSQDNVPATVEDDGANFNPRAE